MATTGVVNSTLMRVYVNTTTTTYVALSYATDASISFSMDMRDITTKDSAGWREILPGLRSGTISTSALYAMDATQGIDTATKGLYDALNNRTSLTLRFYTAVSGDVYYQATAYMSSLELNSSGAEDNVTYSATFEITSSPTKSTV